MSATVFAAVFVSFLFAALIVRPLRKITTSAQTIAWAEPRPLPMSLFTPVRSSV